jgi:membrane-bound metal-dependent hydrolase YbcI (DUF457 family)
MITGHFGLAAGVKKIAPRLPLWSLLLATFWLDVIFTVLSMFGLESFAPMNPAKPVYGEVIIHAPYTHSLIGALLISALTGWLASLRWKKEGGMVVGAVVFSHWILDLLVHRPDLPILPGNLGNLPLLGFGLWEYPVLSAIIELVLALGGAYFYYRSTMEFKGAQRSRALTASAVTGVLLLALFVINVSGL